MNDILTSRTTRRGRRAATLAACALALGVSACAQLPSLDRPAALKSSNDYPTRESFAGAQAAWPAQQWWAEYGDPQLDALVAEALQGSPDMQAVDARLRAAQAAVGIAGSALGPQVSANASATSQHLSYNHLTPPGLTPRGWNDYGRATLDFSWDLDFWGRHRAGVAAAKSVVHAGEAERAQGRLALAAAVAASYADFARLFAERDTAARAIELRRKSLQLFEARAQNGLETQGTVSSAKAALAAAEGAILATDEAIAVQRTRMAALIGSGPDRGLAIARPTVQLHQTFGLPGELAAELLGRRADIVAAKWLVEARSSRIEQKRAEFYPNVNLAAFVGVQSLGLDMLTRSGSGIAGVGPSVSLPIFSSGRLQGELRGTAAAYDEAVALYNRTVTQAVAEVAEAVTRQRALTAQLASAQDAVAAAEDAHRIARNRYDGGLANYLEVLFAEGAALDAQRHLTVLQSRAFALDVALKHALGGGYREARESHASG